MDISRGIETFLEATNGRLGELIVALHDGPDQKSLDALSFATLQIPEQVFTHFEHIFPELCARWSKSADLISIICAFGRVVKCAPHLSELMSSMLVERCNQFDGDVVQTLPILHEYQGASFQDHDITQTRDFLLAAFRLLSYDNPTFADHFRPAKLQYLLSHKDRCIRYLTIRVICLYLHATDPMMEDMLSKHLGDGPVEGNFDLPRQRIDFRFLTLWEDKRIRQFEKELKLTRIRHSQTMPPTLDRRTIDLSFFSLHSVNVYGVIMPRVSIPHDQHESADASLTATSNTTRNVSNLARSLLASNAVLITGLSGTGKSSAIKHVASQVNKYSSMVTLHLNEQSDAKMLVGIYTRSAQSSQFKWHPGILTTAVKEGKWLCIEDIDRAPSEVMSLLLPLIERQQLRVPGQDETIKARHGFKMIATHRTYLDGNGAETGDDPKLLGLRLWRRVHFQPHSAGEIRDIILSKHPTLARYADTMLAVYGRLQREMVQTATSRRVQLSRARLLSTRDLYQWCARVDATFREAGARNVVETIPDQILQSIFLEAVDCLISHVEDEDLLHLFAACIAKEMGLHPQIVDHSLRERVPSLKQEVSNGVLNTLIGRTRLSKQHLKRKASRSNIGGLEDPFALNNHSLRLLEQIAVAEKREEPLLLVGETGIGKTAAVQHLASILNRDLVAINLSQQSEASDLVGGFKPISPRSLFIPLKDEFEMLFEGTFSRNKNQEFMEMMGKCLSRNQWKRVLKLWREAIKMAVKAINSQRLDSKEANNVGRQAKRRKVDPTKDPELKAKWDAFTSKVDVLERQHETSNDNFGFHFEEGKLVNAVREGYWVLLDEINLAPLETLECLSDLLENGPNRRPSILLSETGSAERIEAHPSFRIIAAMNPAIDIGKKDLPRAIRSRFTEIFVRSPDSDFQSLKAICESYISHMGNGFDFTHQMSSKVTELYLDIQRRVKEGLVLDGAGQRPHYSVRTLTRALSHALDLLRLVGAESSRHRRFFFEGFLMCFTTSLEPASSESLQRLISSRVFQNDGDAKHEMNKALPKPLNAEYITFDLKDESDEHSNGSSKVRHWLRKGSDDVENPNNYIVTPFVFRNLQNLTRAASTRKYPVLIQGPTSAGKTSMIEYLAKRSGNKFVRINNHEHTDLQEYLGSYVSNPDGKLIFREGVLVQALRKGHWVVLDELNLAPTDVLEALNRLLDDNRELFIPETQEVVRPHTNFMLFATQNPVGAYGGRKILSRAFRNRFLELHFDDIPVNELKYIISRRSELPQSWCGLIVEVYRALSRMRQESRLFEKNSLATLRDLFRWAFRPADSLQMLAENGYMLLAEKVRKQEERSFIKQTLEQCLSKKGFKVRIDDLALYTPSSFPEMELYDHSGNQGVIWTKSMRRLYCLVASAIKMNEPVLLVGETGCGKTTVCQMLAEAMNKRLFTVNAHQNLETGDLIGAQRPVRNKSTIETDLVQDLRNLILSIRSDAKLSRNLDNLVSQLKSLPVEASKRAEAYNKIKANLARRNALFEWHDGAIVQAMKSGQFFLLDEISLADDSVLERMNSILDPQRTVLLAEKATSDASIQAQDGFQVFATMNPGGEFGKRELSPALRNRFTEIWVPELSTTDDVLDILRAKLKLEAVDFARPMVDFAKWFRGQNQMNKKSSISVRDLLSWCQFINAQDIGVLSAVMYGAMTIFVDTIGANPSGSSATGLSNLENMRQQCLHKLSSVLGTNFSWDLESRDSRSLLKLDESFVTVGEFSLPVVGPSRRDETFTFDSPTTITNLSRIIRGLQISKPLLIEGSPGVGKTALVCGVAGLSGHHITRINLSEQTDLTDLFGSDVPVEETSFGSFAWRDAPFLSAMRQGGWVLLDEMNLASQSVLEGLNACIDHRGEVYISELDKVFYKHPAFRLFATQNPHHQGNGRKGLPSSFVNRFTVLYADAFKKDDLTLICSKAYPTIEENKIKQIIEFVARLDEMINKQHLLGSKGAPWELNLRDTLRLLELLSSNYRLLPAGTVHDFVDILFTQRFRNASDRDQVQETAVSVFGPRKTPKSLFFALNLRCLQVGLAVLDRAGGISSSAVPKIAHIKEALPSIEALMICISRNWPVLLTGSSGCGKTHVLQSLASLLGIDLDILSISADLDANDLVGSYEQTDPRQDLFALAQDIQKWSTGSAFSDLGPSSNFPPPAMEKVLHLGELAKQVAENKTSDKGLCAALEEMQNDFKSLCENEDHVLSDITYFQSRLLDWFDSSKSTGKDDQSVKFKWTDGILVNALKNGQWLVLDNANFCSSSVLDRLNSLLEPHGSLVINENCSENGVARVVHPHPDFRIFLTVNPDHGEISRAMRNRCVELHVPRIAGSATTLTELSSDSMLTESAVTNFHELSNLFNLNETDIEASVLEQNAILRLHTADLPRIECLQTQCEAGLLSPCKAKVLASCTQHLTKILQTKCEYDERLGDPLDHNPLDYLTASDPYLVKTIQPQANQPAWLLEMTSALFQEHQNRYSAIPILVGILGELQSFSQNLKDYEKTLEKGATKTKFGNTSRSLTSKVRGFLTALVHTIDSALAESVIYRENLIALNDLLINFVQFWDTISSLSITSDQNGVLLQAHFAAFDRWLQAQANHSSHWIRKRALDDFKKRVPWSKPKKGLSMLRLWKKFRPNLLQTSEQLNAFNELQETCDQFDQLSWRFDASFDQLVGIRASLSEAYLLLSGPEGSLDLSLLVCSISLMQRARMLVADHN